MEVKSDERLREIDNGEWSGQPSDTVNWPEVAADIRTPWGVTGESYLAVQNRMVSCFDQIVEEESGRVLMFGHGASIRALVAYATGTPLEEARQFPQYNTGITVIKVKEDEKDGRTLEVEFLGTPHIEGHVMEWKG
eukprot:TRINITY_DN1822_c0_g1_i1.p1 TRINITY_DN1822_c0_g1~~TRINITY_DN1822_c0_g1_i1.p1  ORF type:complete len:136 (+),score=35.02 TRINITY_DN1822_c0_g1_i1:468-875(+)